MKQQDVGLTTTVRETLLREMGQDYLGSVDVEVVARNVCGYLAGKLRGEAQDVAAELLREWGAVPLTEEERLRAEVEALRAQLAESEQVRASLREERNRAEEAALVARGGCEVPTKTRHTRIKKVHMPTDEALLTLAASGMRPLEISRRTGVHASTAAKRLRRYGVPPLMPSSDVGFQEYVDAATEALTRPGPLTPTVDEVLAGTVEEAVPVRAPGPQATVTSKLAARGWTLLGQLTTDDGMCVEGWRSPTGWIVQVPVSGPGADEQLRKVRADLARRFGL